MTQSYKCKKCGNTTLEMVRKVGTIHPVKYDEEGLPHIDFDAVPKEHYKQYYQCRICKTALIDENGKVISDHPGLKKWIKRKKKV